MKLLFKQRFFSWFDSYDIYDEAGRVVYVVKGRPAFGHELYIYDANENELGRVEQRIFTFLPKFDLYLGDTLLGTLKKEFTFLEQRYNIEYHDWHVQGDFMEWDYQIYDAADREVAVISKEIFNWTDTYTIEVQNPEDALPALMFVLAVDAEKCSRG